MAKSKSQMGRMSRNKGKAFERKVAKMLSLRGFAARRAVQFDGTFDHDVKTELPFNFECKAVESLNIYNAMKQSKQDASRFDNIPTVVHKKNNNPVLVTMEFVDFIDLLQWATGYVDEENTMDLLEARKTMKKVLENDNDAELL